MSVRVNMNVDLDAPHPSSVPDQLEELAAALLASANQLRGEKSPPAVQDGGSRDAGSGETPDRSSPAVDALRQALDGGNAAMVDVLLTHDGSLLDRLT